MALAKATKDHTSLERARNDFGAAFKMYTDSHRAAEAAAALVHLGNVFYEQAQEAQAQEKREENLKSASEAYDRAIQLYHEQTTSYPDVEAMVHTYLGNVYSRQKMFDKAEAEHKKALALLDDYAPGLAVVHGNLGDMYSYTGQLELATKSYEQSLETLRSSV